MSRIYVDRISPYQSGSVQVDGLTIDTGSLATTGSNTFVGNQVVTGSVDISTTLNVSGITTVGDDIRQTTGVSGNAAYIQNPNYFSQFYGSTLLWRPNAQGGQTNLWLNEKSKAEIQINAFSSSYDNVIIPYADANGTYIADWDGSYTVTPWITIPKQQTPTFNRGLDITGSLQTDGDAIINGGAVLGGGAVIGESDPLPTGGQGETFGMLLTSGSGLFFYDGSNWREIAFV